MKKFSSALALAAVISVPAVAQAADVNFGAEFEVNGYSVDMDQGTNTDTFAGFQQRTLLTADMKGDGGVSFHTGVLLSGDTWSGDNHVTSSGNNAAGQLDAAGRTSVTDQGDGSDVVTMDYGYVQIPMLAGVVRAGRMKASWADCFLACDDRRDRIQYLTKLGNTTVFGLFDKRVEGMTNYSKDDGDMWLAGFVGNYAGWTAGSVFFYFAGNDNTSGGGAGTGYALTDVYAVSPYVKGKAGPVDIEAAVNYFNGGSNSTNSPATNGAFFQSAGTSEFVRVGWGTGPIMVEGQVIAVQDGGLVDAGFDSFSSLIANSPSRDVSPTSVVGIGSAGLNDITDKLSQQFYAVRVTGNITDKWALVGAVGGFNYKNDSANVKAADIKGSGAFYDAQVHYMVTKNTTISATYGALTGDDIQAGMTSAAASNDNADPSAVSLNLNTKF